MGNAETMSKSLKRCEKLAVDGNDSGAVTMFCVVGGIHIRKCLKYGSVLPGWRGFRMLLLLIIFVTDTIRFSMPSPEYCIAFRLTECGVEVWDAASTGAAHGTLAAILCGRYALNTSGSLSRVKLCDFHNCSQYFM